MCFKSTRCEGDCCVKVVVLKKSALFHVDSFLTSSVLRCMWALELYRSNRCHCGTDPIGSPPEEALLGNTSRVKWCRISEAPIIFHAALFGVLNSPESDPSRRIAAGDECPRVHPSLETSPSDTHVRRPSSSITCCSPPSHLFLLNMMLNTLKWK